VRSTSAATASRARIEEISQFINTPSYGQGREGHALLQSGDKVTPADKLIGHSGVKVTPTDKLIGTSGVKVTPADKLVGTWTSRFRQMSDAVGALISTKISGVKMTPADKLVGTTTRNKGFAYTMNSASTQTMKAVALNLQDEATPNSNSKSTITVLNLQDESAPTIMSKDTVSNLQVMRCSSSPSAIGAAIERPDRRQLAARPATLGSCGETSHGEDLLAIGTAIGRSDERQRAACRGSAAAVRHRHRAVRSATTRRRPSRSAAAARSASVVTTGRRPLRSAAARSASALP